MNGPAEQGRGSVDVDPLDIDQALATRAAMTLGTKVGLMRLTARKRAVVDKTGILLRYLKCRLGPGKLSPEEFLKFGLDGATNADLHRFVGHVAQQEMHDACNDSTWFATSKNKLLWQTIQLGAGLPVPETLAVYDRHGRGGSVPVLKHKSSLAAFLSDPLNIPVFCKPVAGVYSVGAFRVDEFDGKTALVNGQWKKSVCDIVGYFESIGKKGYLLQRPLKPHGKLSKITGNSVATLRCFLLMDGGTSSVIRTVLKLPTKGEVADNFWRPDAQLCAIDTGNGKLTRIITNKGSARTPKIVSRTDGFPSKGFKVPDFQESIELVHEAARHFPAVRTQSWDIAITDTGPVLMELNFGGDLSLVQMAHAKGILDNEYCDHLRRCGYSGKLPRGCS